MGRTSVSTGPAGPAGLKLNGCSRFKPGRLTMAGCISSDGVLWPASVCRKQPGDLRNLQLLTRLAALAPSSLQYQAESPKARRSIGVGQRFGVTSDRRRVVAGEWCDCSLFGRGASARVGEHPSSSARGDVRYSRCGNEILDDSLPLDRLLLQSLPCFRPLVLSQQLRNALKIIRAPRVARRGPACPARRRQRTLQDVTVPRSSLPLSRSFVPSFRLRRPVVPAGHRVARRMVVRRRRRHRPWTTSSSSCKSGRTTRQVRLFGRSFSADQRCARTETLASLTISLPASSISPFGACLASGAPPGRHSSALTEPVSCPSAHKPEWILSSTPAPSSRSKKAVPSASPSVPVVSSVLEHLVEVELADCWSRFDESSNDSPKRLRFLSDKVQAGKVWEDAIRLLLVSLKVDLFALFAMTTLC